MDGKTLNLNPSKKTSAGTVSGKGKKFPWKANYREVIDFIKDEYEKYMYHCRIIYRLPDLKTIDD